MPRTALLIAGPLVALVLAGCTTSASPVRPASTAPPRSIGRPAPLSANPPIMVLPPATPTIFPRLPIPAGTPRCQTAQLEVAFITGDTAAGNVEETFELRNRSATGCWVYGYVGFQTLDKSGRPLPQATSWTTESQFGTSDQPTRILLPPGTGSLGAQAIGHAFFNVFTDDVLCDVNQNPVAALEIWPPDETQALRVGAQMLDDTRHFIFCDGVGISPLQVQAQPHMN